LEKEPNEHPGPGAYNNFTVFQIQILRIYSKTKQIVTVPHSRPECTTSKGRSEILLLH
jgi:hypothetical protein